DRLGERVATVGVQEGHIVTGLIQSLTELGVGRADAAVADRAEEFAANQANTDRASRGSVVLGALRPGPACGMTRVGDGHREGTTALLIDSSALGHAHVLTTSDKVFDHPMGPPPIATMWRPTS